jgi:predicted ArsR family transcriptional regulator
VEQPDVSPARRRVLELLKRRPGRTPAEIAHELSMTVANVRLHLQGLEDSGLARAVTRPARGRGRPATTWSLTSLADGLFPDRHADLTVSLIRSMREALGEDALQRVIEVREAEQLENYRARVGRGALRKRVDALAAVRTDEGYMAEVQDAGDGSFLLVENHCPICDAASSCQALCRSELDVFRTVLGDDVSVDREQHLLAGDGRCVYRVAPTS